MSIESVGQWSANRDLLYKGWIRFQTIKANEHWQSQWHPVLLPTPDQARNNGNFQKFGGRSPLFRLTKVMLLYWLGGDRAIFWRKMNVKI